MIANLLKYRVKARKLLHALQNKDEFSYDSQGQCKFNNEYVSGVNILNLLQLAFYNEKSVRNPEDYFELLSKLDLLHFVTNSSLTRLKISKDIESSEYPWYWLENV